MKQDAESYQQRKDPAALFIAAPLSVIAALGFPSWLSETQLLVPGFGCNALWARAISNGGCMYHPTICIAGLSIDGESNLNHSSSLALSSQLQSCVAPMTFCSAQQTDRHFDFLEMLDQAVVGCLWPAAEESMRGKMASSRITPLRRSCLRAGGCGRRSLLGWEHGAGYIISSLSCSCLWIE